MPKTSEKLEVIICIKKMKPILGPYVILIIVKVDFQ